MKIAFVHQPWNKIAPPVQAGSVAMLTFEIGQRLAQADDVIMYSRRFRGQNKSETYEGVTYRRFSAGGDLRFHKVVQRLSRFFPRRRPSFSRSSFYFWYILQVARDLKKSRCDVVHIHNFSQFVPIIRAFNPRIAIVLHMHCEWLTQLDRSMIEARLNKTDAVVTVCDYITHKTSQAFPQYGGRCLTVHNGVDLDQFVSVSKNKPSTSNRLQRLVYVGRLSPEKGLHVLLDAFAQVLQECPDAELEIVGPEQSAPTDFIVSLSDDPMISNLAAFYQGSTYLSQLQGRMSAETAKRVTFTGNIPHAQLIEHLEAAAVFLHPSVWGEPFPLAVLEALAAGVPVVASRIGGLVESIEDGKSGLLVTPDDSRELADALIRLLQDDELRNSMAKAARRRAEEAFSWTRVRGDLHELYTQLCDHRR